MMRQLSPENVKYLVVHCSDSPQGRGDDAQTIHQWHLDRGFDGIGYHAVILEDGTIQAGRPLFWCGAHVRGLNSVSLGVCLVGKDTFTHNQYQSLRALLNSWTRQFPQAEVCGHCDLDASKICPNFNVRDWYGLETQT